MKFPIEYGTIGNSKVEKYLINTLNSIKDGKLASDILKLHTRYITEVRIVGSNMKKSEGLAKKILLLHRRDTFQGIRNRFGKDSLVSGLLQNILTVEYRNVLGEIVA